MWEGQITVAFQPDACPVMMPYFLDIPAELQYIEDLFTKLAYFV
jgi:hypothetical protein